MRYRTQSLLAAVLLFSSVSLPAPVLHAQEAPADPLQEDASASVVTLTDLPDPSTDVTDVQPTSPVPDLTLRPLPNVLPTALPNALPPVGTQRSPEYGLSTFIWGNPATTTRDLKMATDAGFGWQKTVFAWKMIEGKGKGQFDWTEADRIVKASTTAGVKIIARLDFQPDWARKDGARNGPPDNYQDYSDFVSAFVSRYRTGSPYGHVDAVEIWNEVNISKEWGEQPVGQQQAADYIRLLSGAYAAAHAADPKIIVVTAGLSPTGVTNGQSADDLTYMQWLFAAGLKGGINYDVLGAHGNTQAPCVECDLNSLPAFGHPSFYFRRVEQLRDVQVQYGDANRQIWLLEFGWTSDQVHPAYSWFAISEDQKAQNVVKAFQYAKQNWSPWMGVMTLWTEADPTWPQDREEYWWAITNPDGTPRQAYTAVRGAFLSGQLG